MAEAKLPVIGRRGRKRPCSAFSLTVRTSRTVYLCLDSDEAGNDACSRLVSSCRRAIRPPAYPSFQGLERGIAAPGRNHRREVYPGSCLRLERAAAGEETVEIIRMSEVDTQTVEWLWEPYIPFGKVTIVQGNPGEGKTTLCPTPCRRLYQPQAVPPTWQRMSHSM